MKKRLKLKLKWKLLLIILFLGTMFYILNKNDIYMRRKAIECDKTKGYTCSNYEVERYIKYGK